MFSKYNYTSIEKKSKVQLNKESEALLIITQDEWEFLQV